MKCKKCNTENEESVENCTNCGAKLKKKNALLNVLLVIVILIALLAVGLGIRYAVKQDSYFAPIKELFGIEEDDDEKDKEDEKEDEKEVKTSKVEGRKTLLSSKATVKGVDHYTATIDILELYKKAKKENAEDFENDETGMLEMLDQIVGMFDGAEIIIDLYAKGNEELVQGILTFEYTEMLKNIYELAGADSEYDSYEDYEKDMVKELNKSLTKENAMQMVEQQMKEYDMEVPENFEEYFDIVSVDGAVEIYFDLSEFDVKDLVTDGAIEAGIDKDDIFGSAMEQLKTYGIKVTKE